MNNISKYILNIKPYSFLGEYELTRQTQQNEQNLINTVTHFCFTLNIIFE